MQGQTSSFLRSLTTEQRRVLKWNWPFWARPNQLEPPGEWLTWFFCAGRGAGKSRSGAEWIRARCKAKPKQRYALVGRSYDDVRKTMIEGESGILEISAPYDRPEWQPGLKTLTWANGSQAFVFTAERPDQLRGPQFHGAWCDELAAWQFLRETWDNLQFCLRLGSNPQVMVTTTPRPIQFLKDLAKAEGTIFTSGHTFDNAANLPKAVLKKLQREYGGTKLGEQELAGAILDANEGALFTMALIEEIITSALLVNHKRAVVAVDPAEEYGSDNDETGISVCVEGIDGLGYVVEDLSGRTPPETWGTQVIMAALRWDAQILVETNKGGKMAEFVLRACADNMGASPEIIAIKSKDGKFSRGEPVSALYQRRRIRHVGRFPELERQMTSYVPGLSKRSPDRLDALVLGMTHLFLGQETGIRMTTKPKGL